MEDIELKMEKNTEDGSREYILLMKDRKSICRVQCIGLPINMEKVWNITIISMRLGGNLSGLPSCSLLPAPENSRQAYEWGVFCSFLRDQKKIAEVNFDQHKVYILPPIGSNLSHATMVYMKKASTCQYKNQRNIILTNNSDTQGPMSETNRQHLKTTNHIAVDPSYLKTLGQAHSGWIFGAIAELVDNSRDAKATKLEISIDMIYSKIVLKDIPMLSVVDDGQGMTHQEIKKMISFGHKQPEVDDPDRIGKFGIGFKSGAMRLGKDALVLTQTADSRSIAFLSQTLNEGKDNLEIPIVSYRRNGQYMEEDASIQDPALSKRNFRAIKDFSPFNKYLIGEKTGLFSGKSTGTQIYIWNLDEWGSHYSLEWEDGISGQSSYHGGDITVPAKRVRRRPGQMSQQVQLDFSLRAYLEVMFFDPRMKIFIQGGLVKSRPLAKTLHRTVVESGKVMNRPVQLTIGRCQLEWERANCGIFFYWHGRLIEAYKRVGSMIHNGDCGRGVIGVIDVTEVMKSDQGHVWVHNNKQAFQDCEEYAELEKWLGEVTDEYIDKHFDIIPLEKGNSRYNPDNDWVQCDKCRKWRMLSPGFAIESLPDEWFCYMDPFNNKCEVPEEKVERGVINISEKRTRRIWEGQINHEDKSPAKATSKLDRSEQTADRDVGQSPTSKKRLLMVSGRGNGITPELSAAGDVDHAVVKKQGKLKVSWCDVELSPPEPNAGTPKRPGTFRKRGGGMKNSTFMKRGGGVKNSTFMKRGGGIENSLSGTKASWSP